MQQGYLGCGAGKVEVEKEESVAPCGMIKSSLQS